MKRILVTLAILNTINAFAFKEYYSISRSIRSLGMGGAFYGLSDDEYALFYNPAGLSNYRTDWKALLGFGFQTSTSTFSQIGKVIDLSNDKNASTSSQLDTFNGFAGKPIYASLNVMPFSYVQKNFAVGLLLADVKSQVGTLGRDFDTSLDLTALSDSGLFVGFARNVTDQLGLGFNLKGVFRASAHKTFNTLDIATQNSSPVTFEELSGVGFGIDTDLGAIYNVEKLPFGIVNQVSLTLNNLFGSRLSLIRPDKTGAPPPLERTVTLGLHSVFPGYGWIENFHLLLDFAEFRLGGPFASDDLGGRTGSFWKHVNFGVEAPMNGWLILRSGFHQGNLTAGLGIRSKFFELDLATYAEELFKGVNRVTSRRVALRLAFGIGSAPPTPIYPRPIGENIDPKFKDPKPTGVTPTEKPTGEDPKNQPSVPSDEKLPTSTNAEQPSSTQSERP